MRIAVVHSFYRSNKPSGENIAVVQQIEAMRRHGMEIIEVFRYTDIEQNRPLFGLRSATRALTGLDLSGIQSVIDWQSVDVINVHNLLPNFGTKWLRTQRKPIVATLHNFRFTCSNGLLYRAGQVCTDCVHRGPWPALRNACYQDSHLRTVPVAVGPGARGAASPIISASSVVIAQSNRVAEALTKAGVHKNKIALIPGFVEDFGSIVQVGPTRPQFAFVGRSSPEKGLRELLQIWPHEIPLHVFGADEHCAEAELAGESVAFKGVIGRDAIRAQLPQYTALVFPGRVWEGAIPLAVREALEAGVPVIALAGSSAADFISETGTGIAYRDHDSTGLGNALEAVSCAGYGMRLLARETFKSRLSEQAWSTSMQYVFRGLARKNW